MSQHIKCDLCNSDAGDDPCHATIDENGHVHICDGCFYPEHYDLGVLWRQRDELLEALRELIRWVPVYPKAADGIVGGRAAYQRALDNAKAAVAKAGGAA